MSKKFQNGNKNCPQTHKFPQNDNICTQSILPMCHNNPNGNDVTPNEQNSGPPLIPMIVWKEMVDEPN